MDGLAYTTIDVNLGTVGVVEKIISTGLNYYATRVSNKSVRTCFIRCVKIRNKNSSVRRGWGGGVEVGVGWGGIEERCLFSLILRCDFNKFTFLRGEGGVHIIKPYTDS